MKVIVQNNQIEKAIRDLKKKLTKEGFFSEIKERRFYDKPSVQRKKKQAKAAKRRRKRMRKMYWDLPLSLWYTRLLLEEDAGGPIAPPASSF